MKQQRLKNETTARNAMGKKFRDGKRTAPTTDAEKLMFKKLQRDRQNVTRHDMEAKSAAHKSIDNANEDENVGTKALNDSIYATEEAADVLRHKRYSFKLKTEDSGPSVDRDNTAYSGMGGKLGRNARDANLNLSDSKGDVSKSGKAIQKNLVKKEIQKNAVKEAQKEAANHSGKKSKRFVDNAEDLAGKLAENIAEFLEEHPEVLVIIFIILLIVIIITCFSSSTGMFMGSLGNASIETSFTADDNEILTVENNYKGKETALQQRIDNIESEYPDYDEYRYELSEINHNPYEIAALLTVLYEDYTEAEVRAKLNEIFDKQYVLTIESIVETRTRTYTDDDGDEYEEEYEYYILKVKLKNNTIPAVIRELGLNDDQMSRYELLMETSGNKGNLFASDIYSAVTPVDVEGYDVAPEALTDTRFANMIREAEKYLGYPYVWGGSNPQTSFDCSGFVSWVINHCGNGWNVGRETANGLLGHCTRVSKANAKPGDLIFFQGTYNTSGASHVGIYVGDGMMIHCGKPIQYTSINTNYWQQHFYTFGRLR